MNGSPQLAVAAAALGACCLVSLYVGARTLVVWRRTRGIAELAIGLNVLSISIGGALFAALTAKPELRHGEGGLAIFTLMIVTLSIHPLAVAVGNWRIFRPGSRMARLSVGLTFVVMGIYAVIAYMPSVEVDTRNLVYEGTRLLLYGWGATECFRYAAMLRRRVALGLAEPIVAHRIRLWGVASVAQIPTSALPFVQMIGGGDGQVLSSAASLYMASGLGVTATTCIALAFFPPAATMRWIESRHVPA